VLLEYYDENYVLLKQEDLTYKIFKITPHSDGGFNVLMPYCKVKKGYISKHDKNYSKKVQYIGQDEMIQEFSVDRDTKLSIHRSGFIQFSGQGIISGIDPVTGKSKGISVQSSPLTHPIKSGPTFTLVFWGLPSFEKFTKVKRRANTIVFEEDDLYLRYYLEHPGTDYESIDWDSFVIEGFFFGNEMLPHVKKVGEEYKITLKFPKFMVPGTVFTLKVIFIENSPGFIGLLASRVCTSHEGSETGYILSGPTGNIRKINGDTIGTAITCSYPKPPEWRDPMKNLNFYNYRDVACE